MKKQKHLEPTKTRLKDQGTEVKNVFTFILIILSGCLLYLDKIFNYFNIGQDIHIHYYETLEAFLWHIGQTVSPMLLILVIAIYIKKVRFALLIPLSVYSIQICYILNDSHYIASEYFWAYTISFIIFFIGSFFLLDKMIKDYALNVWKLKGVIRRLNRFIWEKRFDVKDLEVYEFEVINLMGEVSDEF